MPEGRPRNAAKTKKDLLNYEPTNTSNPNHRPYHGRIYAERRTAQNGSKLPEPSKPGLCAMEGGAESKETMSWKDKESIWAHRGGPREGLSRHFSIPSANIFDRFAVPNPLQFFHHEARILF